MRHKEMLLIPMTYLEDNGADKDILAEGCPDSTPIFKNSKLNFQIQKPINFELTSEEEREDFDLDNNDSISGLLYNTKIQKKLFVSYATFIAISGVVITTLFIAIGKGLYYGSPEFLLITFALWCTPILFITVSTAEMVCFLPIISPFLKIVKKMCRLIHSCNSKLEFLVFGICSSSL